MGRFRWYTAYAVMCTLLVVVSANWWQNLMNPRLSNAPPFSKSQLYQVPDIGLEKVNGTLVSFGDFNSDKFVDLFLVTEEINGNETTTKVQVFLWNSDQFEYQALKGAVVEVPNILNVVPGDFNYDGKLDILVSYNENDLVSMQVHFGTYVGFEAQFSTVSPQAQDQPLVLDANADLIPDMFGTAANGSRAFWVNDGQGNFNMVPLAGGAPIAVPHSNGFVDIDGDCLADLVVVTQPEGSAVQGVEIWLQSIDRGSKSNSFGSAPDLSYFLPPGAGQLSFGDINRDGTMDVLFPVCYPADCSEQNTINIFFNLQGKMCSSVTGTGTNCYSPSQLCTPTTKYQFAPFNTTESGENVWIVPSSAFQEAADPADVGNFFVGGPSPLTLRLGDFDSDGFPDLLLPVLTSEGPSVQLWRNQPPSSPPESPTVLRSFVRLENGTSDLTSIQGAYAAAWVDFNEAGDLDILVLFDDALLNGQSKSRGVVGVYNNFQTDSFFLKALGLNGRCPQWCNEDNSPTFPDPVPYGVNMPGGVWKFTLTDRKGAKSPAMGCQLTQSAYAALQTPYVYFGLGQVSNYIDTLFYGVSIANSAGHSDSWPGVIPNAQVAAFPHPAAHPSRWTLQMYVVPSGITFYVILACVVTCLALGASVIYLTIREKRADDLEAKQKAHLFHFNAL